MSNNLCLRHYFSVFFNIISMTIYAYISFSILCSICTNCTFNVTFHAITHFLTKLRFSILCNLCTKCRLNVTFQFTTHFLIKLTFSILCKISPNYRLNAELYKRLGYFSATNDNWRNLFFKVDINFLKCLLRYFFCT